MVTQGMASAPPVGPKERYVRFRRSPEGDWQDIVVEGPTSLADICARGGLAESPRRVLIDSVALAPDTGDVMVRPGAEVEANPRLLSAG